MEPRIFSFKIDSFMDWVHPIEIIVFISTEV